VRVLRRDPDGRTRELAVAPPGADLFYDVGVAPGVVHQYRVKLAGGKELGPVWGASSAEMLLGGDFEGQSAGSLESTLMFHRAYGPPWWEIEPDARSGGEGRFLLRVRHGEPPRRDGLHSRLLPVDPCATYRQTGWTLTSEVRGRWIGRQTLTNDLKPAGGRIVAYTYAPVVDEKEDGWLYSEERLDKLPKDAAYVQVWALAFNVRADVRFDDLSLIDERVERLAAFDSKQRLAELQQLAAKAGDQALAQEAVKISREISELETELRSPQQLSLSEYLDRVRKLDGAVRQASDLTWDLKILGLAK